MSNEITVNPVPSSWITQPIVAEQCEPAAGSSKATANGWSIKLMYSCNMLCWSPEMVKMAFPIHAESAAWR